MVRWRDRPVVEANATRDLRGSKVPGSSHKSEDVSLVCSYSCKRAAVEYA